MFGGKRPIEEETEGENIGMENFLEKDSGEKIGIQ